MQKLKFKIQLILARKKFKRIIKKGGLCGI